MPNPDSLIIVTYMALLQTCTSHIHLDEIVRKNSMCRASDSLTCSSLIAYQKNNHVFVSDEVLRKKFDGEHHLCSLHV